MSRWWLHLFSKSTRQVWDAGDAIEKKPAANMSMRELAESFDFGDAVSYRSAEDIRSERRDGVAKQTLAELKSIRALVEKLVERQATVD